MDMHTITTATPAATVTPRRDIIDLQNKIEDLMFAHFEKVDAYNRAAHRVSIAEAEVRLAKARSAEVVAELKHLKAVEVCSKAENEMRLAEADLNSAEDQLSAKRQAEAIAAA